MDLTKTIEELRGERETLQRAIALLEQLETAIEPSVAIRGRTGRKSMSAEERQEVSARMKKYWESRRRQARNKP